MLTVEKIDFYHDVNSFSCSTARRVREMNEFLQEHGSDKKFGTTYVVVPHEGASEIIDYFTVAPDPGALARIPTGAALNDSLVHLRYFAVAQAYQNQGLGERILGYVIEQVLEAAQIHPEISSIALSALDETAKNWYLGRDLGFRELVPGSLLLTLPVEELQKLNSE